MRMSTQPTPTSAPKMCTLHIEGFSPDLKQEAKTRAAVENTTLGVWVADAMRAALAKKAKVTGKSPRVES